MKILYLHPKSWTGEYPVLTTLRGRGHTVCVLEELRGTDAGGRSEPARRISDHFLTPGDGIRTIWYDPHRGLEKILTWPLDRFFKKSFEGRNLAHRMWIIARAIRFFHPDVVVCSDGFSYAIPASMLKYLGIVNNALVVSYIGGDILDFPEAHIGKRRTPTVSRMIRRVIAEAEILRPVSELVARALRSEGAPEDKLRICPSHLGVDASELASIVDERKEIRNRIRTRYGIAENAPVIVTMSSNQYGKGLHLLAEAWPQVLASLPNARWLLCGPANPWLETGVLPLIASRSLNMSVINCGPLTGKAVYEHLAAADLNVNPSLGESLNMVVVEAAAVGTPSISTNRAGISEWIASSGAGIVIQAGEVATLADGIIVALGDPARLARFAAAGRDMATEFTLERIAGQLEGLFEQAYRESILEH